MQKVCKNCVHCSIVCYSTGSSPLRYCGNEFQVKVIVEAEFSCKRFQFPPHTEDLYKLTNPQETNHQ